ncbi:hypothetical protein [Maribacter aestuarii]|nr:hypothetical protein [Maribacter aestuarii]
MKLGLDSANFAKDYFTRNGISEAKIDVSSKEQTDLVESNATEQRQV